MSASSYSNPDHDDSAMSRASNCSTASPVRVFSSPTVKRIDCKSNPEHGHNDLSGRAHHSKQIRRRGASKSSPSPGLWLAATLSSGWMLGNSSSHHLKMGQGGSAEYRHAC